MPTKAFLICMIAINKQQSLYLCRAYTEKGLRIPNEILSPKYMFVLLTIQEIVSDEIYLPVSLSPPLTVINFLRSSKVNTGPFAGLATLFSTTRVAAFML